jgi:hypothetical protein
VGSGYCAYRAHLAFLAQASEAVVYFEGLEAPLAAQALFLLGATGLAVMLAARALSGRARVRDNTAPATDPVTTGVREPQGTVGEAPALSGGPASDPNAVGSARRDAGEAGRDQEGPA